MTEKSIFTGAIAAGGACLLALYVFWPGGANGQGENDGPGPNLIIEVAGAVTGRVVIDLLPDVAPAHVAQIVALAEEGAYNGIVFHRVIQDFMAQTGDVEFGHHGGELGRAGLGGSEMPDLEAEFSEVSFDRGTVGMARSMDPNSANSQFFIMFDPAPHLDGQYTVVGRVIEGMTIIDALKLGDPGNNGAVEDPDYMESVSVDE